jgi:hypothetical protein
MSKRIDLNKGDIFNKWTVIHETPVIKNHIAFYMCRCSCGTERLVRSVYLRKNLSKSCGCLVGETSKKRHVENRTPENFQKRFWQKVSKSDECWTWIGSKDCDGYGVMSQHVNGIAKQRKAHIISYELHFGEIPTGICVLHKCDNPSCVNPEHLFLGTQADNQHDRKNKGRQAKGEANGRAKLTEQDVRDIRYLYKTVDISQTGLANKYGVSQYSISQVVLNKKWKHVN